MGAIRRIPNSIHGLRASDDLNLIRGVAAILVLTYHIRSRFFYHYGDLHDPSYLTKFFFAVNSFGHGAVIIFFVLSGYFISTSVLRDGAKGRWSWNRYAINRLTRLYVVLLPGLVLTVFWDRLGLSLYPNHPAYTGASTPWINSFWSVPARLHVTTFLANAFFLQEVFTPPLGSNGALWSLSYEFWYYVLFPMAWFALVWRSGWRKSLGGLALLTLLLVLVGSEIALYFPIWLLGTAVCFLPQIKSWKRNYSWWCAGLALVACCAIHVLINMKTIRLAFGDSQVVLDYITGISFAIALYFLLHNQLPTANGAYASWSGVLAGFSYTLYVVHLPLVVFLRAALVPEGAWQFNRRNYGLAALVALVCLVYAYVISRFTEAKTDALREFVLARQIAINSRLSSSKT